MTRRPRVNLILTDREEKAVRSLQRHGEIFPRSSDVIHYLIELGIQQLEKEKRKGEWRPAPRSPR
jgi:hypothetical protein